MLQSSSSPEIFVTAECSIVALKVFWRRNARSELFGTLLRDNEDEKRYAVSGSNVWLIEPEQMDTSSTSRPIGIEVLWLRQCSRQWWGPLPPLQLGSKKRTM